MNLLNIFISFDNFFYFFEYSLESSMYTIPLSENGISSLPSVCLTPLGGLYGLGSAFLTEQDGDRGHLPCSWCRGEAPVVTVRCSSGSSHMPFTRLKVLFSSRLGVYDGREYDFGRCLFCICRNVCVVFLLLKILEIHWFFWSLTKLSCL